ncbi:MAG: glycosyl transferase family 1 [Isosphaeraceae bacterium]|jgi:glycosyltransferase involved in cell wall biosynthesis|nr:MAG: glycosyl transferase family 1 [Isosphaeraceae bacterium]
MKLAWFTHRYAPCLGGAETFGRAIVRRFVGAGAAVDVFTSDAFDLWYFNDRRRARVDRPAQEWIDGARVRRFAVRHYPGQRYVGRLLSHLPVWSLQCCWASYMPVVPGLTQVRGDYDAVVAVGFPYTIFSYAGWKTARAAGAPLILVPFLHLSTPGDVVNRSYTRPHQVRLLREADTVCVQTKLEAEAVASWGIPERRILTLGMAVEQAQVTGGDRDAFRQRLGIPVDRPVIGQLGANDPNKGTCDLVRAVARLNASRPPDQPIHLLLAGATSPDFERFLTTIPDEARQRWLTVLGLLPEEDRASFYAALDVFAMPSRTDSFGIVYLEAWANRLPVVAAAAGGVAEVVRHEQDGLLIRFGDLESLSAALKRLIEDRPLAKALGQAGQIRISAEGYTWESRFAVFAGRVWNLARGRSVGSIYRPHAVTGAQAGRLMDQPGRPA